MAIPGEINKNYCPFEQYVQKQLVDAEFPECKTVSHNEILEVKFQYRHSRFLNEYHIRILYHSQQLHEVYIMNLDIDPSPKIHMYDNHSLCLYYPPDISPFRRLWITKDLIPMAILWTHQYERWLVNGNDWKGWEAPGHWFLLQQLRYRNKQE